MEKAEFIKGNKIYLRSVQDEDAYLVYKGKNSTEVRETLFLFRPVTHGEVLKEQQEFTESSDRIIFTICYNENDIPVGQTALVRIDYVSRAAVFYIAIYDPEYWSKGIGGEATSLMLHYAFDILNLNRIQLHVSTENERGVAAYKKAGFIIEGTLRQAMYHNNRYIDFYVMGILREEYYKK